VRYFEEIREAAFTLRICDIFLAEVPLFEFIVSMARSKKFREESKKILEMFYMGKLFGNKKTIY